MGKVVSFENIDKINPPKSILLDTSFIINLTHEITNYPTSKPEELTNTKKGLNLCKNFLQELLKYKTRILTCDLVLAEFSHEVYKDIVERKCGKNKKWYEEYKNNPSLISSGHPKIARAYRHLSTFLYDDLKQIGEDIRRRTFKIMKHLDICPTDAYIVSVAIENNLSGIAHFNPRDFNKISKHYPVDSYAPPELAEY